MDMRRREFMASVCGMSAAFSRFRDWRRPDRAEAPVDHLQLLGGDKGGVVIRKDQEIIVRNLTVLADEAGSIFRHETETAAHVNDCLTRRDCSRRLSDRSPHSCVLRSSLLRCSTPDDLSASSRRRCNELACFGASLHGVLGEPLRRKCYRARESSRKEQACEADSTAEPKRSTRFLGRAGGIQVPQLSLCAVVNRRLPHTGSA